MPKSKPQPPLAKKERNAIKSKEDRYVAEHHEGSYGVTEREFEGLLTKVFPPISQPNIPAQVKRQTSVARPSDGYIGKRKNRGKIAGKEG